MPHTQFPEHKNEHWLPNVERVGVLGDLITRANHYAITVSDVANVPNRSEDGVVTQFFMRDPDGYYVELCNCDILTKYCLAQDDHRLISYNESSVDLGIAEILRFNALAEESRAKYLERVQDKGETKETLSRALIEANNSAPLATRILRARKAEAGQIYIPPAIFEGGDEKYQPKAVERRKSMISRAKLDQDVALALVKPEQLFKQ
ncbi:hypothetical protein MNEG_1147 [Monoraphidium neglectum]|uniref:VOC domain-containing protein n=1 Tax=Monoraphidium neglectum TaxID=145388 RepID=A0A0D2NR61_9CHLO|nr:hypothetical protein MNEG_1147 [Monoraphidium neglectum]KIZ06811.1 hypothetical protein MNEG_1147 [Monoraphidium neglectum]|eukprot:XP_013905830.1 hypothetical protein MNEG_1147 [Monoraphidium neglectum]